MGVIKFWRGCALWGINGDWEDGGGIGSGVGGFFGGGLFRFIFGFTLHSSSNSSSVMFLHVFAGGKPSSVLLLSFEEEMLDSRLKVGEIDLVVRGYVLPSGLLPISEFSRVF